MSKRGRQYRKVVGSVFSSTSQATPLDGQPAPYRRRIWRAAGLQLPQHLCQVLVNVLHPAQNRRLSQWSANRLNSGDGSSVLLG